MATENLLERFTAYITPGASTASGVDGEFIQDCLDEATSLVDGACGTSKDLVPNSVLERAYIEVGSELFNRRAAPNGISQFAAVDGSAIRVARDPMVAARPMLAMFLPGGFS